MWQYNYSTDPSRELYHHGIKGQKWGVRRKNKSGKQPFTPKVIKSKTKNGTELTMLQDTPTALSKFIARCSPKAREHQKNSLNMTISAKGKKVGDMQVYKESKDSLNIIWVGVNKSNEGHGYGTAAMKGAIKYAKQSNCKQVTLEVPGTSPNARHIYEKLGFKSTGETLGNKDDMWGGLTRMRLDLK